MSPDPRHQEAPTELIGLGELSERLAEPPSAFLYVEDGPGAGQLLEIGPAFIELGRASSADLRLRHPSISRRHARVWRAGASLYVEDLGSQNGTFVNEVRIADTTELHPADTIGLGSATVRVRGRRAGRASAPPEVSQRTAVISRSALTRRQLRVPLLAGLASMLVVTSAGAARIAINHSRRARLASAAAAPVAPSPSPAPPESTPPEPAPPSGPLDPPEESIALAPLPRRPTRAPPNARLTRAQLLAPYLKGQVQASVAAAKAAGESALVDALSGFADAWGAGERARADGDLEGAIASFEEAKQWDTELSGGHGYFAEALKRALPALQSALASSRGPASTQPGQRRRIDHAFATPLPAGAAILPAD